MIEGSVSSPVPATAPDNVILRRAVGTQCVALISLFLTLWLSLPTFPRVLSALATLGIQTIAAIEWYRLGSRRSQHQALKRASQRDVE